MLDGNLLRGRDGLQVDVDGDGAAGGTTFFDFRTLPITRIPNTNIFGYVYDSYTNLPLRKKGVQIVEPAAGRRLHRRRAVRLPAVPSRGALPSDECAGPAGRVCACG